MRIVSIVGARPQFVKLAPISHEFARVGIDHLIIHTGQHYDPMLSDVFFRELGIPAPDVHLGIGSGTHGHQTGSMMASLDDTLPGLDPDWVLVYGDTNSTLAAAVCAAKLHLPLAHLEAGLRSYDRAMPEEVNRVLTDHAADLLLAPTQVAAEHLTEEGLSERSVVVGDVMTDVLLTVRDGILADGLVSPITEELGLDAGSYSVATIHRAENTDDRQRLSMVLESLRELDHPVVVLAHPRLVGRCAEFGLELGGGNLLSHPPVGYRELVASVMQARGVVTDSGGLQKEAFLLRVPATTVRPSTEWVETIKLGWNVLVEPGPGLIAAASRPGPRATNAAPYGDGRAAERVAQVLLERG